MKEKLISEYISKITMEDINNFALKNGINLNDKELEIIYNHVKNNWRTIIYGNPREILDDLKENINNISYQKIESLYVYFKNRYSNFLYH
ncbi:MAG TPA: hypothetical protein IAC20_06150 [Candidatus Faecisoma merdavium]|nr:hypothetical protein [Candidatus Faecisoma merdavium]